MAVGLSVFVAFALVFGASCMPGGIQDVPEITDEIQEIIDFGTAHVLEQTNSPYVSKVTDVTKVQYQVVSGFKYYIDFEMGETECLKVDNKNLDECAVTKEMECRVVVWDQPWLDSRQVTESSCRPKQPARPYGGGIEDIDVNSAEVFNALAFAEDEFNARENEFRYRMHHTNVVSASSQIVAGVLYRITADMGPSVCTNTPENRGKTLNECPVNRAPTTQCIFKVLHQPWLKPEYELLDYNCTYDRK